MDSHDPGHRREWDTPASARLAAEDARYRADLDARVAAENAQLSRRKPGPKPWCRMCSPPNERTAETNRAQGLCRKHRAAQNSEGADR